MSKNLKIKIQQNKKDMNLKNFGGIYNINI